MQVRAKVPPPANMRNSGTHKDTRQPENAPESDPESDTDVPMAMMNSALARKARDSIAPFVRLSSPLIK